jgi:hypothetical protein
MKSQKSNFPKTCDFLPVSLKPQYFRYHHMVNVKIINRYFKLRLKIKISISQLLNQLQNARDIAETCNSTPRTGIDDITSFFGP